MPWVSKESLSVTRQLIEDQRYLISQQAAHINQLREQIPQQAAQLKRKQLSPLPSPSYEAVQAVIKAAEVDLKA